jgi:thiamine biosynthesis protein ThiI
MGSLGEKGMKEKEKAICLFSGGIDSPVAFALMARKLEVIPLHFCLYPFTCERSFSLVIDILKTARSVTDFEKAIIYPWAEVFSAILRSPEKRYRCLLCRKSMFRAAELICERKDAVAIVTGEALGQKASQTASNLLATSFKIKYPILRPLLGLDKEEIRALGKKLGVYSDRHAGCCQVTPENPTTHADARLVEEIFSAMELQEIIEQNLEDVLEVDIGKFKAEDYLDSLARF